MSQQNDFQNSPLNEEVEQSSFSSENIIDNTGISFVTVEPSVKKKGKLKKILLWILIVLLVLILSGVLTIFILIQKGKSSLLNVESMNINLGSTISDVEVDDDGKIVDFQGKKYVYNEDMTAICVQFQYSPIYSQFLPLLH